MAEDTPSMLNLVLRKLKSEKATEDDTPKEKETGEAELEQAMADFSAASSPKERAAAFKAALRLAKG